MSVADLGDRLSAREVSEWGAYLRLENKIERFISDLIKDGFKEPLAYQRLAEWPLDETLPNPVDGDD